MVKKTIFSLGLLATLSFSATIEDALNAAKKGDNQTALAIYENLASNGNPEAQFALGVMYDKVKGVKQDYKKAFEWYEKAAKQGYSYAQYSIGDMYINGQGVKQDKKIAKEWFGKACDGGVQNGCDNYKKLNQQGY